jgi:type I restriction enzyme, S subunit
MSLSRNLSGCQVFNPSDLPAGWACLPLRDRLELLYGRALKEELRKPGEIDVFGSNGKVGSHNVHWLDGPGVLVGRKGTVGAVHYSERAFWPIDTVYYVKPLDDDDLRYLYYLLDYLPLKILNAATGVPGLSRRDAYALRGAFPSVEEQGAVAQILHSVDAALERTQHAVDKAKEVKRAVVQSFFYNALGETAYADRPAKSLPFGWSLSAMRSLLASEPKNGVSPKTFAQPPGVPTFSIAAIRDGRVDLSNRENLKYADLPAKVADKFRLNTGDVLIVRGNANAELVGKAAIVAEIPEGCVYPDITKRVVFQREGKNTVTPEFGVLTWNHPIVHNQVLRRAKTSNGTLKINNRDVSQIVMPVPTPDEQRSVVEVASAAEATIDALSSKLQAYEELKRSLMHSLLSGRMRVNDVRRAPAGTHE